MLPSALIGPAETVAMAVFRRQALRIDTDEGGELVIVVSVGTCVLLSVEGAAGCVPLAVGSVLLAVGGG